MNSLSWIYAFNLVVNSVFAFFTTTLLVEVVIRLLRMKEARWKVFCRALPFFKLLVDLFLYQLANWALQFGIDPLLAERGTRILSIAMLPYLGVNIQFGMQDGKTFSIADMIALSVDGWWIRVVVLIAVAGIILSAGRYLVRFIRERNFVHQMLRESTTMDLPNLQPLLTSWIQKKQISLATTSLVSSPCITGKMILFPSSLWKNLSPAEVEAIIAHEMAHFQWKDCGIRLFCSLVAGLFWWIPTHWWQQSLEQLQEEASDEMVHRFGISRLALARAMLKTAQQQAISRAPMLVSSFGSCRFSIKNRIQKILQEPKQRLLGWKILQYGLLAYGLLSILFGKLWIF